MTNVCNWCGKECDGDFCSEDCSVKCFKAHDEHMSLDKDLCVVCQERFLVSEHTCLDVGCKESWAMAWEK
jgi:hypothetical protein